MALATRRETDPLQLKKYIREDSEYKPGIIFYDVAPLFSNPSGLSLATTGLARAWQDKRRIDQVAGMEARGFVAGGSLANKLRAGFVMLRKPDKLPGPTSSVDYDIEYGSDTLHMQDGAIKEGDQVLIHDDLLATGGTAMAAVELVREAGGEVVGLSVIVDLPYLHGTERLRDAGVEVQRLIIYNGE